MAWKVAFHEAFAEEFLALAAEVRRELAAHTVLLEQFGPQLRRPYADTLKGSQHANMKELRFAAGDGAWRVAYAFDQERRAILLVAGDKSGQSARRFYGRLIAKANARFSEHLEQQRRGGG
ncbi:MAG TPA: type II toxin-antitoxin system RelE/ParE family toxin [Geminicoccaceae bacterium]|nr:type II toxin-antitoxin system RelE/ParE family toxin [Geminicoccaceae bacterium]